MREGEGVTDSENIQREEFRVLDVYYDYLFCQLPGSIGKTKLLEIRDHIIMCRRIAKSESEEGLVKKSEFFWDIAVQSLNEDTSDLELFRLKELAVSNLPPRNIDPQKLITDGKDPSKKYELDEDDKKLLKLVEQGYEI